MLCLPSSERIPSPTRHWGNESDISNSVKTWLLHDTASGCVLCQSDLGHRVLTDRQSVTLEGSCSYGAFFTIRESRETDRHIRFEFVAASDEDECADMPFTISPSLSKHEPARTGRYPSLHSRSESTFNQARQWYFNCASRHSDCVRDSGKLPKRLLKLVTTGDELCQRISLCLTSDLDSSSGKIRYLALSYCWGGMASIKTLRNNIEHRMLRCFGIVELPALIQNAVMVTQKMNFRYLWVDALCICQDDREQWEVEVAAMAKIFGGSAFTISVLLSPDVHTRFFKPRSLSMFPIGFIEVATEDPQVGEPLLLKIFIRKIPQDPINEMKTGPLSLRARPLQERLLAPGVLHYGRDQIFWERYKHPLISETGMGHRFDIVRLNGRDCLGLWQNLMVDYNRRDMTEFARLRVLHCLSAIAFTMTPEVGLFACF